MIVAVPGRSQETATYTYDALGRLVASAYDGGPRSGQSANLGYDPAGNRTYYAFGSGAPGSGGTGSGGGGTSTGGGTGGGGSSAPLQALAPSDTLAGSQSYSLLPAKFATGGASPLNVQTFTIPAGGGSRVISVGGNSVSYTTPAANVGIDACSKGSDKVLTIQVVVNDSSNASVTSSYLVTIGGLYGTASPCF